MSADTTKTTDPAEQYLAREVDRQIDRIADDLADLSDAIRRLHSNVAAADTIPSSTYSNVAARAYSLIAGALPNLSVDVLIQAAAAADAHRASNRD